LDDCARNLYGSSPSAYVDQIDSTVFSWAQAPAAWATIKGPQAGQVSETVNLQLGTDPTKFYRITGISFTLMFPTNPLMVGANERILQFKDGGGNIIYSGECQYVFSSGSSPGCSVGFPSTLDGVRSISITHQSVNEITLDSGEEYHVGLDNIRIAVEESEMVKVNVLEVRTPNGTPQGELLPPGTLPIPYLDTVKLEITLKNVTGVTMPNWELQLFGIDAAGASPSHDNESPMRLKTQGEAVYSAELQRLKWNGTTALAPNESVTMSFEVNARRSGMLKSTYSLSVDSQLIKDMQPIDIMPAALTYLELNDEGADENLKAVMFWAMFNETSSGSFYSGTEQTFPNDATAFVNFFNGSDYLPLYDLTGVYNEKIITYDTRSIEGSRFIAGTDYCNNTPNNQDELEPPKVSWHPNITSVIHCEDFRYMEAQSLINGFLNYERRAGTDSAFGYARKNFGGSLGNDTYALWGDYQRCVDSGFLNTIDEQGNIITRTYQDALAMSNVEVEGSTLGWKPAVDWLNAYLNCQLKHVDSLRRLTYIMTHYRFMPQIERAIDDFYSKCDWQLLEFSTPNELLCDPTEGAFSLKQANLIIQESVIYAPPGEDEQSFPINQEFGLRICAGGCATQISGTREVNGTRTIAFSQAPAHPIDNVNDQMIRDAYEATSSPLPTCSKIFELNTFAGHREQLANCYGPSLPSILQPVLWTDRQVVDANDDNVLEDYTFSNYSWGSRVYQKASTEDDATHYPR